MNLLCYPLLDGAPALRPAGAKRQWMDDTTESFAYRCLPLNIANAHGWVLDCACDFTAWWDGRPATDAIRIESDAPACREPLRHYGAPLSHFGHGILTFHVGCLFRTDPRINLWVGGPPNEYKDGIVALSGVIETDWAPYTFTMNWRFIRPNTVVSFKAGEPVCFFFPVVSRNMVETIRPEIRDLTSDPDLRDQYRAWRDSRDAFHHDMIMPGTEAHKAGWQKDYYRGVRPDGAPAPYGHQAKLRLRPFVDRREATERGRAHSTGAPAAEPPPAGGALAEVGGRCAAHWMGEGPAPISVRVLPGRASDHGPSQRRGAADAGLGGEGASRGRRDGNGALGRDVSVAEQQRPGAGVGEGAGEA